MIGSEMWHWIRDSRRKKILESPFPRAWADFLQQNVAHYSRLDSTQRKHLHDLVQVFVAEKKWEGCGGLELTDEIKVTIAGEACLIVLEIPHDLYGVVDSILIYPTATWRPNPRPGFFEISQAPLSDGIAILGEAWRSGPVVLAWDAVKRSARHPESGHNLVYHEFAHKLDMVDGIADGTPPLDGIELRKRWVDVFSREYKKLREESESGKRTFLDPYGATNEAEFFAVVTEQFFDQPAAMRRNHEKLYELLRSFYRQDPAHLGP